MYFKIYVDNSTTPDILDENMTNMFSKKQNTILHIDASKCTSLRFKTIMKFMPIFDKHRDNSRKYLRHTTIIAPNKFISRVINFTIPFIRPEQPVFVDTLSKL